MGKERDHRFSKLSPEALSRRQCQILARIGAGKTSKEIAVELNLSLETIHSYRAIIRRKLNLHSTAALAAYGVDFVGRTAPGYPCEGVLNVQNDSNTIG